MKSTFVSPTYGQIEFSDVVEKIVDKINKNPHDTFNITIGTDSQNFDITKIVLVIVLEMVGKGGMFFYQVSKINRIDDIRAKLFTETQMSLECADELLKLFEKQFEKNGFDYTRLNFSIHVDAGENGKTKCIYCWFQRNSGSIWWI